MMATCPEGHTTAADDYCDVCGAAVLRLSETPPRPIVESSLVAPTWTAVVNSDRDYYKRVLARGGPDAVDFPEVFPERRIILTAATLIGRANRRQGVRPGIDLSINPVDLGVSTQHAILRAYQDSLTITDLGSTNGTSLNDSEELLGNGAETRLVHGDRIHVGAWTTITIERSGP
jgi:hypothetical protein